MKIPSSVFILLAGGTWTECCREWFVEEDMCATNGRGEACDTRGGQERCMQGFGGESQGNEITWKT
jgi:hypothetical protein